MMLNKQLRVPSTKEMLKSVRHAKTQWRSKTAFEKWCYLYGIGKAAFGIIKKPIFLEDQRIRHWFAYFYFMYTAVLATMTFYSIYYYILVGDFYQCLPPTCLAALGLAVS